MPHTQHLLSIAMHVPQRADLSRSLVTEIANRGCNILECRVHPVGDQFAATLLVGGNWSSLGRLETALPAIASELGLTAQCTRSAPRPDDTKMRPYAVEIIAPQEAGLLRDVLDFFRSHESAVVEIVAQHYDAAQTGAALASLQMVVHVPISAHPPALRESFMDLCDELHADGLLDPIKN